jgi:prophage tail gpP-like protein
MSEFAEVIFGLGTSSQYIPSWTKLKVRKTLDELVHTIEVETAISDRPKITKHARFGVYYSNTDLGISRRPVSTAFVDNIDIDSSSKSNRFLFNGRSAARDIIDSKWSATITGKTLFELCWFFANQFGIKQLNANRQLEVACYHIGSKTDPTSLVSEFSFEAESPWEKLQQEAANQGFIITSSQIGGLYVWRVPTAGSNQWGFQLKEGQNISSFRDQDSGAQQFYKYTIKADDLESVGYDKTCPITARELVLNLTDVNMTKEKLSRRVKTEIRRRRERRVGVTVGTWTLPAQRIRENQVKYKDTGHEVFWEVNFLTPVEIPSLAVSDTLLTSQVELTADRSSMSADIQLSRPEEYL